MLTSGPVEPTSQAMPVGRVRADRSGTLGAAFIDAYRYAFNSRGISFASPQVALVAAYVLVYGAGLLTVRGSTNMATIVPAIAMGFIGIVAGTAVGWLRFGRPDDAVPRASAPEARFPRFVLFGVLLTVLGLAAIVLYFIRIGDLPLFMASAEQARVDAAEIGGAPLRVTSLLAIPGAWLLLAAACRRGWRSVLAAWLLVAVVAAMWILTANRAPAFVAIQVAVVITLLASGRIRLGRASVVALVALALGVVLAAGVFGALRARSAPFQGPPVPPATTVPGRPPNFAALVRIAIGGYLRVPVQNLQFTIDAVPERIGWPYLQPLATVLPGKQTTFDQDIKTALEQGYIGGGTVPGLLGESYANFGPPGWLIVPFLLAVVLAWLFALARRLASPAGWALYSWALVHVANAMIGGLIVASVFPYVAVACLSVAILLDRRREAA
jgi:oligosaccharide repeat unit polymerase